MPNGFILLPVTVREPHVWQHPAWRLHSKNQEWPNSCAKGFGVVSRVVCFYRHPATVGFIVRAWPLQQVTGGAHALCHPHTTARGFVVIEVTVI